MNCSDASSGTTDRLEQSIKHRKWIPVRSPGLAFYAEELVSGQPFSLIRYGEGEWRFIVPAIPEKTRGPDSIWRKPELQNALRHTLLKCRKHPRYWPAMWHQRYLNAYHWRQRMEDWLKDNGLDWIKWHDGRLFRRAIETETTSIIVKALRNQPLPVVLVGPAEIAKVSQHIPISKFIPIHRIRAYWDKAEIQKKILAFKKPAVIMFSAGCVTKMMIHHLFPRIGNHSTMIDFGAFWDGLCGVKTRPYHKKVSRKLSRQYWYGR